MTEQRVNEQLVSAVHSLATALDLFEYYFARRGGISAERKFLIGEVLGGLLSKDDDRIGEAVAALQLSKPREGG